MSHMTTYRAASVALDVLEYNYLLPVLRQNMVTSSSGIHCFIGDMEEVIDMLDRLRGLYGCFIDLDSDHKMKRAFFRSHFTRSMEPFRNFMRENGYTTDVY